MKYIPLELQNIICSYIERPLTNKIMRYLIYECYEKDYNPYYVENWYDSYCYDYSFSNWYFMYRKQWVNKKSKKYKHTPSIILIGIDKIM